MKESSYLLTLILLITACGGEQSQVPEINSDDNNLVPIYVHELTNETFRHYINIQGNVESDRTILISPKTTATVTKINVRTGDHVQQGQILAILDGDITKSQIAEVENQLQLSKVLFEKQKNLRDQGIGSEVDFLQAENQLTSIEKQLNTLNRQYSNYTILATISGTVNQVMLKEGETVNTGVPVFQIANSEALKVTAEISEAYINTVDEKDSVEISFPSLGITHKTTLDVVSRVIDPSNRTFKVEIYVPSYDGTIRPNMISRVRINDFKENDQLVIPINIITQDNSANFVLIAEESGSQWVTSRREVITGKNYKDQIVIKSGLKKGDLIITTGYQDLSEGKSVSIKG